MGKKDKKRSEAEAATVVVAAEAVTAAGVGEPAADVGEVSMAVDGDTSVAAKKDKKKKDKKEKKDSSSSSKKEGKKEKSKERKELEIPADALSPIAHPLAGRKLNKSTLKLVKRGMLNAMLLLCLLLPWNHLADFAFFRGCSCSCSTCQARCQRSRQSDKERRERVRTCSLPAVS
jgi:hypothetical protein